MIRMKSLAVNKNVRKKTKMKMKPIAESSLLIGKNHFLDEE